MREQYKQTAMAKPKREKRKVLREGTYPDGTPYVVYDQLDLIELAYALGEKKYEEYRGQPRAPPAKIDKPAPPPPIFEKSNVIDMLGEPPANKDKS